MPEIVGVFDTTVGSYNIGNNIIMESVYSELKQMFPGSQFYKLPPMDIGKYTRSCIGKSDITFFGGTNSLNTNLRKYRQWDLNLRNIFGVRNIILMGMGWWQYEEKPVTSYSRYLYRKALSSAFLHSVRDSYTQQKLKTIGIRSVNTGCPTMWSLEKKHTEKIPAEKPEQVVFTVTDYNKDIERDKFLIRSCLENYATTYCFPQGTGDINYIKSLGFDEKISFLKPDLTAFDEILKGGNTGYVGTRLHAGIRALQNGAQAMIIGIDNRAIEMKKDFDLPVLAAEEIKALPSVIRQSRTINLKLPEKEIKTWKEQFINI